MTAYIGFENLPAIAAISGGATPGYPVENCADWFTYTWWKGLDGPTIAIINFDFVDLVTVDYWAIAAHNMPDIGGSARLQYHDGEDWLDFSPNTIPPNNAPMFVRGPEQTSTQFRMIFQMPQTVAPLIGVICFGKVLELPEGIRAPFIPPPVAYDNKVINSVSQTGQFLGRSIERFGEKMTIRQDLVSPAWMRANWATMADIIETQPFFYCWNYEQYPEDTVYAWLDRALDPPHYTDSQFVAFDLNCKCLHRIRWF